MTLPRCGNGSTQGSADAEGGPILRDKQHEMRARITLKETGNPPFAITSGIRSVITHTAFAAAEMEPGDVHDAMKEEVEMLIAPGRKRTRSRRPNRALMRRSRPSSPDTDPDRPRWSVSS